MKVEDVKNATVVGAGAMGHGIAQILAMTGTNVALVDINDELLNKGMQNIKWSLERFTTKRTIRPEDAEAALQRIKPTTDYQVAANNTDFAIEAVLESMDIKKQVFSKLDKVAPEHAILATNTSALSITEIGKNTNRPNNVVGMHFFNPAQLMPLVEVIKGQQTSDETANVTIDLAKKLGKTPILVKKDVRGFIVNGILGAVFNEGFWAVQRGETTKETIDSAAKYKAGFPMGVFELADYVGLDVLYDVSKVMEDAYGERAKLCPIVEPLVKQNKLGQKTGEGFYNWRSGRPRIPFELAEKFDVNRFYSVAANAAAWLLHDDAATPSDIDTGMKFGSGWPSGPCELADRLGIDTITAQLKQLKEKYGDEMYAPSPLLQEYIDKGWLGRKSGRGFHKYT